MVSVHVSPGRVAVPEWLHGRFPIERGAVLTQPGERPRQWKTIKISRLALVPRDAELYRTAVYFAQRFISDMRKQGFELLTAESDMLVTGPYAHLESDTSHRPSGAIGRHLGQEQFEQYADFRITGQFIRTRPLTFEFALKHVEGNFAHTT